MNILEERPWTTEESTRVYDILVEHCGALKDESSSFIHALSQEYYPREYRFCGSLGFGGKLWRNADRVYVSCYKEDMSDEVKEMIRNANRELEVLTMTPENLLRVLTWIENGNLGWGPNSTPRSIANAMKELSGLRAARIAYASEFDGDVGSIHENIRALKAKVAEYESAADKEATK